MYLNVNNPVNYQLQGFGQNGVRTISTDQLYIQGEYYRVLVAEEDSYVTAVSVLGDDLTAEFVYAGTTIYGLFTEVSVSSGSLTAYIAGPTDIEDVWAYINAYGQTNAATIEAADCAKDAIAPLLDKYYAKASLVMVPSLYKTSIVYSERPLTTDGQLAFTRSNDTATRVGPDGYIEKVRTNLFQFSEQLSNAYWGKTASGTGLAPVITDNFASAPDGSNTAERAYFNAVGTSSTDRSGLIRQLAFTTGQTYTISVYAKSATGANQILQFRLCGTQVGSEKTVTNDWQRFTETFTATTSLTDDFGIQIRGNNSVNTSDLILWGFQLELSDVMTNYIPTTAATVSVGPVANLPRLNYPINSDGSVGCPSLLLEPQRTNLITYSEQFDSWAKSNVAISSNTTVSPDGYQNADTFTPTVASAGSNIFLNITTGAVATTMSVYARVASGTKSFRFYRFNATDGVVSSPTFTATTTWQRFTWTTTPTVATSSWNISNAAADLVPFIIFGAQVEVGAYATSYIPTIGASVTRGADACSKTGISSLIGQTEGTLFVDFKLDGSRTSAVIAYITDGTTSNAVIAQYTSGGLLQIVLNSGGTTYVNIVGSASAAASYKLAIAYKLNDVAVYLNGASVGADTSATMPVSMSRLDIAQSSGGASQLGGAVNQTLLFKTRLTNQELQDLTTL